MHGYPKKIRVGDQVYKVRFVKRIRGDKRIVGLFDPNKVEILIQKDQTPDEMLLTLIHELFHALEYEYEIKIKHKSIYKLEHAIFDLIQGNPDIFEK